MGCMENNNIDPFFHPFFPVFLFILLPTEFPLFRNSEPSHIATAHKSNKIKQTRNKLKTFHYKVGFQTLRVVNARWK